jgi:hypothetical protein
LEQATMLDSQSRMFLSMMSIGAMLPETQLRIRLVEYLALGQKQSLWTTLELLKMILPSYWLPQCSCFVQVFRYQESNRLLYWENHWVQSRKHSKWRYSNGYRTAAPI